MTAQADQIEGVGALMPDVHSKSGTLLLRLVAVVALIVVFAAVFGRIMSFGLRRDELMFVPPAELLGYWGLYGDFFYNHVPDSAWYFRAFYLALGSEGLLASARIGVFFAWLLMASGVGWATYRLSRSSLLAVFFVVGLAVNETLLSQAGMAASNNLLPLSFLVWAIGLFMVETQRDAPRPVIFVIVGVLLSVAAGMKVSAAMFIPPVAIAAVLMPVHLRLPKRLKVVTLPTLLGGLLGALPLFMYLLADPGGFWAHVVSFHTGPHVAYWQANAASEPGLALGLGGKILLAYSAWFSGAALIGVMVLAYLAMLTLGKVRRADLAVSQILLAIVVMGVAAAFSFVPTPGFPQYFIQPLIVLPLLAALIYRALPAQVHGQVAPLLAAGLVIFFVLGAPRLAPGLASLSNPSGFTTARIAQGGQVLRETVADSTNPDGPVATLMPIYPLEAHLPVYAELATGPFAFRIADHTNPELAKSYTMTDTAGLTALFDSNPPAAFLLGYDPTLEEPLLRYAETNGYLPVTKTGLDNRYGKGVIYLKTAGEAD